MIFPVVVLALVYEKKREAHIGVRMIGKRCSQCTTIKRVGYSAGAEKDGEGVSRFQKPSSLRHGGRVKVGEGMLNGEHHTASA